MAFILLIYTSLRNAFLLLDAFLLLLHSHQQDYTRVELMIIDPLFKKSTMKERFSVVVEKTPSFLFNPFPFRIEDSHTSIGKLMYQSWYMYHSLENHVQADFFKFIQIKQVEKHIMWIQLVRVLINHKIFFQQQYFKA